MSSLNRIIIMGYITKDLELKTTQNNKTLCNFTVAVNRTFEKDKADFIQCVVWNKPAEYLTKYGKKGSLVLVEGALNIDQVDNSYYTKINVSQVSLIGGKSENEQGSQSGSQQVSKKEVETETFDDLGIDDSSYPF